MSMLSSRSCRPNLRSAGLGAALLAMVLLSACGGHGGGETNPGQPPPTDTVTGTVTFKGAPLAGAQVLLYTTNSNYFFQTATSDADGTYRFTGLGTSGDVPSNWLIWAMKDGYGFYPSLPDGAGSASSANVVRRGCNNFLLGYNGGGVGLDVTGINYTSLINASLAQADFTAYDGSSPRVSLARTGQTTVYATGDDADRAQGVAWPAQRFVDNADGTVADQLTGLIWLQNAGALGPATWTQALAEVAALASGAGGLTDHSQAGAWRLPNLNELESLVAVAQSSPALPLGHPFTHVSNGIYWTSTGYTGIDWGAVDAWAIRFSDGSYINDGIANAEATASNGVWAVKGAGGGTVQLQATGLWDSSAAGDDGATQKGVHLTYPRWIDHGDGTTTDTVTGLVWMQQAGAISGNWAQALAAVNALQSGQCGLSDGSTAGTWRMPTRNELQSLADREQGNHADYFDNTFDYADGSLYQPAPFSGFAVSQYYWTSTTDAADTSQAWAVYSCDFGVYPRPRAGNGYALAVR